MRILVLVGHCIFIVKPQVVLRVVVVFQLVALATAKIKGVELLLPVQHLETLLHYVLFLLTTVHHHPVTLAFAMDSVELVVVLSVLRLTSIHSALAIRSVLVVAATALHGPVHVLVVGSSYEVFLDIQQIIVGLRMLQTNSIG